ncbi:MAG: RICIN domain-containing protein [Acidimicrobiales bacterium]
MASGASAAGPEEQPEVDFRSSTGDLWGPVETQLYPVPGAAVDAVAEAETMDDLVRSTAVSAGLATAMERDLDVPVAEASAFMARQLEQTAVAASIEASVARDHGGTWIAEDGTLQVGVTTESAAAEVRAAGAEAVLVERTEAELLAIHDRLNFLTDDEMESMAGVTGWSVDLFSNRVLVETDDPTTIGAYLETLGIDLDAIGFTPTVEHMRTGTNVFGGERYWTSVAGCSFAFGVVGGILTAGHCGGVGSPVADQATGRQVGQFTASSVTGVDAAFIALKAGNAGQPYVSAHNGGFIPVYGAAQAPVGSGVCRSGATSGFHCGVITSRSATINAGLGFWYNQITTTACASAGDSGGALLWSYHAQGMTSTTSAFCGSGRASVSSYQPLGPIARAWGLTMYVASSATPPPRITDPPAGSFQLKIAHSGQCVDVQNESASNGAYLVQYACGGSLSQYWTAVPNSDGFNLKNAKSGLCMAVNFGSHDNGINIVQWTCGSGGNSILYRSGNQLQFKHSMKCLTLHGASQTPGYGLEQAPCVAGAGHQNITGGGSTPPPPPPPPPPPVESVIGGVVSSNGAGVLGVQVELFAADADGVRQELLESGQTGADGSYSFTTTGNCHVVVLNAPDGMTFADDALTAEIDLCVEPGETSSGNDATLFEVDNSETGIAGTATDAAGPVSGVHVDLFSATADGARGSWLQGTDTAADGVYGFTTDAGCFVLTFVAADGWSFNGSEYRNVGVCVEAGETVSGTDVALVVDGDLGRIGGMVTLDDGPVAEVGVDLFAQADNGDRGQFLGSADSGADGSFGFDVPDGCYVLTVTAPAGTTFAGSGWFQPSVCVDAGETAAVNAVLDPTPAASLGGLVDQADSPVEGVVVTFYETGADGSRSTYRGSVTTGDDGRYTFGVPAGCSWMIFVAPDGMIFDNGSQYLEAFQCVEDSETITNINATLL